MTMRLTGSRTYYKSTPPKMPPGLVELIEGLTRDVLKNNPTDIYGFCAGHMQQLLEIRDGPLQRKYLTLEDKIARAQGKVRERAEKRRQRLDNELFLEQRSDDGLEIRTSLNIGTSSPESTAVHHEPELINSSEVEVSHELTGQKYPMAYQEEIKNNDDFKNVDTEPEVINESSSAESYNQTSDINSNTQDVPIPLSDDSNVTTTDSTLDNQNEVDKINPKDIYESTTNEQIKHDSEFLIDNTEPTVGDSSSLRELDDSTENHISTAADTLLIDSDKQIIENLDQIQAEKITDDEQNYLKTINFIKNNAAQPESKTIDSQTNIDIQLSSEIHSIQQLTDSNITNSNTIIENESLTNSIIHANNEVNMETKTIDISFNESPNMELQDAFVNSDVLDSLFETNTDSDIVTLITQESTGDELKENGVSSHGNSNAMESDSNAMESDSNAMESNSNSMESDTIAKSQVNKDNTEYDDKNAIHKEVMDTQYQTKTNDLIENSIIESNENNNVDVSGHDTPTKLHEISRVSNQETSNMDLETAAITIQKVFRTFLFKSRGSTFEDTLSDENDKNKEECNFPIAGALNERRPHGITRMDTVLQTVNEEKSLSLSTDDSSTLSSAATVIQAHVRGFLVRNKLNSNKTISTNSLAASNSNEPSLTSLDMDNVENKNKTVLNIHIVPEGGNYFSRDESLITSMDLSLDSSPPSSINLHPLSSDVSERRKQLKREDAIQSISPPSNNSGKLSEDVDSVKELPINHHEGTVEHQDEHVNSVNNNSPEGANVENDNTTHIDSGTTLEAIIQLNVTDDPNIKQNKRKSLTKMSSDEMDVVTPYISNDDINTSDIKLMHSGEFHDAVLPTKVSRSDTSVASEFKNVLVYFLLWNHS